MSQNLAISETGLKLIKAFEGYRPVDRELISGQRIVGYGHRLYSEDAVIMNKREAQETLLSDLEPFEEMINSEVHAPITQSQFDALCSFAFNIGPKAFLQSDTLRALNNGRPLDAANGLDIWRKSEIDGKTYVVDALMRRRTAEKALFLRTERDLVAGREDLPPIKDTTIVGLSTEDALPVFTEGDANGIVATAPYSATMAPTRRREDGPAGALQLSELDIIADSRPSRDVIEVDDLDIEPKKDTEATVDPVNAETEVIRDIVNEADIKSPEDLSPIAAAATDIVARLDALIDDAEAKFDRRETDWPNTLIESETSEAKLSENTSGFQDNVVDLNTRSVLPAENEDDLQTETGASQPQANELSKSIDPVEDELPKENTIRQRTDSAAKYIETNVVDTIPNSPSTQSGLGLWIPVILGFVLLGASGGTLIKGAEALLGNWGPIIAFTGLVIGISLIMTGIYAALRMNSRK